MRDAARPEKKPGLTLRPATMRDAARPEEEPGLTLGEAADRFAARRPIDHNIVYMARCFPAL